jgi:hypothetical protein
MESLMAAAHQQHSPNGNSMHHNNGGMSGGGGSGAGSNAQAHHHYSLFDDSYGNQWDNKQMYAASGGKNFIENESVLQVSVMGISVFGS